MNVQALNFLAKPVGQVHIAREGRGLRGPFTCGVELSERVKGNPTTKAATCKSCIRLSQKRNPGTPAQAFLIRTDDGHWFLEVDTDTDTISTPITARLADRYERAGVQRRTA